MNPVDILWLEQKQPHPNALGHEVLLITLRAIRPARNYKAPRKGVFRLRRRLAETTTRFARSVDAAHGWMPTTLSTIKLPLHTACLAFCPNPQEKWLAVGSYELSACRTIRQGRLHILEVADSHAQSLSVLELFSHELPGTAVNPLCAIIGRGTDYSWLWTSTSSVCAGVFDLKWNTASAGNAELGLALADGSVAIFAPPLTEGCWGRSDTLVVEEGTVATCIDFSPRAGSMAVSTASGQLSLLQVSKVSVAICNIAAMPK